MRSFNQTLTLAALLFLFTGSKAQEISTEKITVPADIAKEMPRVNSNFVLKLNKGIAEGELSPLLIWMHGGGGSTEVQGQNWPGSEKHFRFISEKYPLSVLFPQAVGRGWDGASMEVLIEYVLENYPIDPNRVYLAGGSMGGAGTWLVANHNPDLFAALVPCMGGGLNRKEILGTVDFGRLAPLPSWSFCGGVDEVTPIDYPLEIDSILHSLGGNPKLTIYEDMGHGGPAQKAWENEELYDWLLSQERKE